MLKRKVSFTFKRKNILEIKERIYSLPQFARRHPATVDGPMVRRSIGTISCSESFPSRC